MKWTTVLGLARNRFTGAHGTWPESGDAKVTRGEAARLIDGAVEITDGAGLAWDWFPVALAVLAYEKEGDKFPPPAAGADQLVGHPQTTYLWWALDFLGAQLDERGVPVRAFTQAPVSDAQVLELLERVTWDRLQALRATGASPSWHAGGLPSHPWEGTEAPAAAPTTQAIPSPIPPTMPTPPPIAPQPPITGPALPDVGGGLADAAVKLFVGYIIVKEIFRRF